MVYLRQIESGMKRRLILPLILRFLGQNKIQIRTIFEPSNESTPTPSTLYMGKRPTGFETEPDDQMALIRQWLLHKREKDCKKVEPDKQSVTPTPKPEEQFLTQDVDPYEDGVLGDDWDFDDDY